MSDSKNHLLARISFSTLFLLGLAYNMLSIERQDFITKEECLRDYTFQWTDSVNQYLRQNVDVKNRLIIQASAFMDFMIYFFIFCLVLAVKSFRAALAYAMFFIIRSVI